jgi:hypothetical protein
MVPMNSEPAALTHRPPNTCTTPVAEALYPSLLGAAWNSLAAPHQRAHCNGAEISRTGVFRIEAAENWVGRLLARGLKLPRPTPVANVRLVVQPTANGETWRRDFDGHSLVTFQSRDGQGRLLERFAALEFHIHLQVENGGLLYNQVGAALWRGWVPLPAFLAPRVDGSEMPDGPDGVRVSVRVTMPLIGLLIAYEGRLNV